MVFNSPAIKMMRLFNAIHGELRNITRVKLDTFKRKLDTWLLSVPDTPIIDSYKAAAESSNSLVHQAVQSRN